MREVSDGLHLVRRLTMPHTNSFSRLKEDVSKTAVKGTSFDRATTKIETRRRAVYSFGGFSDVTPAIEGRGRCQTVDIVVH